MYFFLPSFTATLSGSEAMTISVTDGSGGCEMTEDEEDIITPTCVETLPSPQVSTSDHIDLTPVRESANKKEIESKEETNNTVASPLLGGVEIGPEFNNNNNIEGGERTEIGTTMDTNYLIPPLNMIMKPALSSLSSAR